jgi:hypothetical protein
MTIDTAQENLCTAQNSLNIETVNLFNGSIEVGKDIDPQELNHPDFLTQSYRSVTSVEEMEVTTDDGAKAWIYKYRYRIGIRLINHEDEEVGKEKGFKPILEITATFSANYFSENKVSEECIAEFAKENVGYNVWPFWREYAQATCNRMGLSPVLEIPLYKVSKKAQK